MATASPITFQLLSPADELAFEAFFRIYQESIQPREQKSKALISKMAARPDYQIILGKQGGTVVAFSILFAPAGENFRLLEYMAVDSGRRNAGLGGEMFRETVRSSVSHRREPLPLVLEVDSDHESSPDRAQRTERLRFYKRLGCVRIDSLSYILPLAGREKPPEMVLLLHLPEKFRAITKSELRRWLETIYHTVYDCPPDDPRIEQMLEGVSDPPRLV
jgi:hypothetical protein